MRPRRSHTAAVRARPAYPSVALAPQCHPQRYHAAGFHAVLSVTRSQGCCTRTCREPIAISIWDEIPSRVMPRRCGRAWCESGAHRKLLQVALQVRHAVQRPLPPERLGVQPQAPLPEDALPPPADVRESLQHRHKRACSFHQVRCVSIHASAPRSALQQTLIADMHLPRCGPSVATRGASV